MTIPWLFPSQLDNSQTLTSDQIASALEILMEANDADELTQVLEEHSETLFSSYALTALYLTFIFPRHDEQEEALTNLSLYFYLLGYARFHGIAQTQQRFVLLFSEPDLTIAEVFPLSPSESSLKLASSGANCNSMLHSSQQRVKRNNSLIVLIMLFSMREIRFAV